MHIVYNPDHAAHQGKLEMFRGRMVPCHEVPQRQDQVAAVLQSRALGPLQTPSRFDDALLMRIHSPRYLQFLQTA